MVRSDQFRLSQVRSGQVRSGQVRPVPIRSGGLDKALALDLWSCLKLAFIFPTMHFLCFMSFTSKDIELLLAVIVSLSLIVYLLTQVLKHTTDYLCLIFLKDRHLHPD